VKSLLFLINKLWKLLTPMFEGYIGGIEIEILYGVIAREDNLLKGSSALE
jgi:hypothetical protein